MNLLTIPLDEKLSVRLQQCKSNFESDTEMGLKLINEAITIREMILGERTIVITDNDTSSLSSPSKKTLFHLLKEAVESGNDTSQWFNENVRKTDWFSNHLNYIPVAQKVVRNGLINITAEGVDIILKGELGALRAAGVVTHAFREKDLKVMKVLDDALVHLFDESMTTEEVIDKAVNAFDMITSIPRFGHAVATKLITLARPDIALVVNSASINRLGQLLKLPTGYFKSSHYRKVLEWANGRAFCIDRNNELDSDINKYRAALLDCFLYIPNN